MEIQLKAGYGSVKVDFARNNFQKEVPDIVVFPKGHRFKDGTHQEDLKGLEEGVYISNLHIPYEE